jgi:hypothetical protein
MIWALLGPMPRSLEIRRYFQYEICTLRSEPKFGAGTKMHITSFASKIRPLIIMHLKGESFNMICAKIGEIYEKTPGLAFIESSSTFLHSPQYARR